MSAADAPQMYIGCGCVVVDDGGAVLFVRETKSIARGRLALPGGKLEADESIEAAAVREVEEETGLVVEIQDLLGVFHCERTSEESFGVNFVYSAIRVGGALTESIDHPELVWLPRDEIHRRYDAGEIRGAHVPHAVVRALDGFHLDRTTITPVPAAKS